DKRPERWAPFFLQAAECLVSELEREPAEPILLNLLGVLCYELGALGAAKAAFGTARRLDPSLPHVEKNLAAVRARAKQRSPHLARGVLPRRDELHRRRRLRRRGHPPRSPRLAEPARVPLRGPDPRAEDRQHADVPGRALRGDADPARPLRVPEEPDPVAGQG